MRRSTVTFFQFLFLNLTGTAFGLRMDKTLGRFGGSVLLPCIIPQNQTSTILWLKNGNIIASRNNSVMFRPSGNGRFSILDQGGLNISGLLFTDEGNYSCMGLLQATTPASIELLVVNAPERHPDCFFTTGNDSSFLLLNCTWDGAHPLPTLHWEEELDTQAFRPPVLNDSQTTNTFVVKLSKSQLHDGQTLTCKGHHLMLGAKERSCSVTLKAPYPQGDVMRTAFEGDNVTLTCTEASSLPPAKTTWRKTIRQEEIIPSSKYIISELGPTFSLTIVNISKQDEDFYFCRSENPVMVQELEVFLTVKSSATYAGGIVGGFIAVLIIGVGITVGTSVYRNRDRICLGNSCGQMLEEQNDVLNLVDSDEDEIINEHVSRITTTANGHTTSLVQIHRIPSSDHEDLSNTETEETVEPPEEGPITS